MGYHCSGNQLLYNGFTGEQIYSEIFIGPTYYMRLKHMVKDKINYRATGKRNFLTRQTNQGRANDGGLKIGEMERDGIMAHGLSYFLNESYMVRGDQYYMAVCNKTGTVAIYNPEKNLFLSPFAYGPLVFNKNVEGEEILDAISKFGRSFSLLRIPFALKLLIQELQVMNIQMRIITEDNIDQLTNLSFQSNNINKLLHIEDSKAEQSVKQIIQNYTENMKQKMRNIDEKSKRGKINNETIEPISVEELGLTPPAPSLEYAASPNFVPPTNPFGDDTDKNKVFLELNLPLFMQEKLMSLEPNERWEVVLREKKIIETSPDYPTNGTSNQIPNLSQNSVLEGSEISPAIKGGSINIFSDPNMNAAFINLKGESQAQILQMEPEQRDIVMQQIILKSARQSSLGTSQNIETKDSQVSVSPLTPYFTKLPLKNQLGALQDGYKAVSNEFSKLEGKVAEPLVTVYTPETIEDKLARELPLLSVEKQNNLKKNTSTSSDIITTDMANNNSNNESNNESNNVAIKKIII